jgi:hypothetical protein
MSESKEHQRSGDHTVILFAALVCDGKRVASNNVHLRVGYYAEVNIGGLGMPVGLRFGCPALSWQRPTHHRGII